MDSKGALPLLAVLVIIGVVLLMASLFVVYLTLKAILTLFLVGIGFYLLIKPDKLSGLGATGRTIVPLVLIILGVLVYTEVLEF